MKNKRSKLNVACRRCGHRSVSTRLNNLQHGQSPACLCAKKTEAKLLLWFHDSFPEGSIASQVPGCLNLCTNRTLPFDFGLHDENVLVELDGEIGHFGRGWRGVEDDGGMPQRDFFKEQWALQEGRAVIRLLQEDVYSDCWSWQDFLTLAIQHASRNSEPCGITQDAMQYKSGIYRELRSGVAWEVGHFQPSRHVRIPYLTHRTKQVLGFWQIGGICFGNLYVSSEPPTVGGAVEGANPGQ